MDKAPDAYRTISEVAEDLDIAQHVLRFWETRFAQIRPLKRGGGRRYYRPDDVELLKGIRHLLYREGYTIKGVQRILKDQGAKAVQAFGRPPAPVEWQGPAEAPAAPAEPRVVVRPASYAPAAPQSADAEDWDGAEFEPEELAIDTPPVLPAAPALLPRPAKPPGQVAMFRGGLARLALPAEPPAETLPLLAEPAPVAPPEPVRVSAPTVPVAAAPEPAALPAERQALLAAALDEIETCRSLLAAALAARPR